MQDELTLTVTKAELWQLLHWGELGAEKEAASDNLPQWKGELLEKMWELLDNRQQ